MVRFFVKLEGVCRSPSPYVTEGKVYPARPAVMDYTPEGGLVGTAIILDDQDDKITICIGPVYECHHIHGKWVIINPEE